MEKNKPRNWRQFLIEFGIIVLGARRSGAFVIPGRAFASAKARGRESSWWKWRGVNAWIPFPRPMLRMVLAGNDRNGQPGFFVRCRYERPSLREPN